MSVKRPYIVILILLSALAGYCQELKVEAVYYNGDGVPYKIERKYFDKNDNSYLYVRHTNTQSVCLRRREYMHQDTLIIQEEYCNLFYKKTMAEEFAENDSLTVSVFEKSDSIKITYYKEGFLIGDTMLAGGNYKEYYNQDYRDKRVPLILSKQLQINPDSLLIQEIVKSYYLNNNLAKIEWIDKGEFAYNTVYFSFSENLLVCNKYTRKKDTNVKLFRIDSISWNKDTSILNWKISQLEWGKDYITKYKIYGNILQIMKGDSIIKEIQYLGGIDLFRQLLINNEVYDDPLYSFELPEFERIKENKITYADSTLIKFDYTWDKNNHIKEKKQFKNKLLVKKVTYKYD